MGWYQCMGLDSQAMTTRQLAPHSIALWQCSPCDITAPSLLAGYESLLTNDERKRKNRFRFHQHRHLYLVTRAMEKTLLARYTGIAINEIVCHRNSHGKPYLCQSNENALWHYNLSHTDDLIVMAITQGTELGVDVESTHRSVAYQNIMHSFFTKSEIDDIERQVTKKEKNKRFYQYWTLKEAYIKAIGKGIATTLQGIEFNLSDLNDIRYNDKNTPDDRSQQHYLFDTTQGHIIALSVASTAKEPPIVERKTMIPLVL